MDAAIFRRNEEMRRSAGRHPVNQVFWIFEEFSGWVGGKRDRAYGVNVFFGGDLKMGHSVL